MHRRSGPFVALVALVAVAGMLGGCAGAPVRTGPDLVPLDEAPAVRPVPLEAETALLEVDRAFGVSRQYGELIWPGYRLHERTLLLFDRTGEGWIVGAPRRPRGGTAARLPGTALGTVWRIRLAPGALSPNLPFVQDVRVDGLPAFAIRIGGSGPPQSWFRLLVHEVFHTHQHAVWGDAPPPERACRYPLGDVENLAWAEVEERTLGSALATREDPKERADAIADLSVLRSTRRGTSEGAAAATIERHEERLEGTARYVELRYAEAAGHITRDAMIEEVRRRLGALKLMDVTKWRYYQTGAALGMLFDRMAADGAGRWTRRVDAGDDLDAILAERVPVPADVAVRRDRLATVYQERAARGRLEREVQRQLGAERSWRRRFATGPGVAVTIRFEGASDGYYVNRGPTIPLEDCSRLVTGVQSYVSTRYGVEVQGAPGGGGRPSGRPMVMFAADGGQRLEFRAPEPDFLRLDGAPAPAASAWERSFERELTLEHAEWHVRFRGDGRVTRAADGALFLELRSPIAAPAASTDSGSPSSRSGGADTGSPPR